MILSRQQRETARGLELVFWLATAQGPCEVTISNQRLVFLIPQVNQSQAIRLWQQSGATPDKIKPLPLTSFNHQQVSAIYARTTNQFKGLLATARQASIPCYEADIKLAERFLMERFIRGVMQVEGRIERGEGYWKAHNPKVSPGEFTGQLLAVSLDIECSPTGELYSVGLSYGNDLPYSRSISEVIMLGQSCPCDDVSIRWVSDERQLLITLQHWFHEHDPDIVIGWAVSGFDMRLLAKRADKLGLRLNIGRDGSALRWIPHESEQNSGTVILHGRAVLDGIDQLKNASMQFESYSLEFVSQAMFGEGKLISNSIDKGEEIKRQFEQDPLSLARYNLKDCLLVERIFSQAKLIDYAIQRAELTGLSLERRGGAVAAFTNLYLPLLHRSGYIAPNLEDVVAQASPGGYVMESSPGLYDWVLVLDFKSLYPSIIRTFCIDPMGMIEGLNEDEATTIPGFKGARFSRIQHHLPGILDHLAQAREDAKQQGNQVFQYAIKIIMNSMYGVLGSAGCRFHDTRLASSITMRGHQIMRDTRAYIEEQGMQVIYGDTDSTFVWLESCRDYRDAVKAGKQLETSINRYWKQRIEQELQLNSQLEIEFETCFRRFFMPTIRGSETGSKKRYAGLKTSESGEELLFKGLENVRSDWTPLAQSFQQQLYSLVFSRREVDGYVREVFDQLLQGGLDEQLVYHKRLRRPLHEYSKNVPPQVRAARFADEINAEMGKPLQYQQRGRIAYLMTLNGPEPEEYRTSTIDYQHYIDKQLRPIAEAILPFVNQDFDQIISDQMDLF